MPTYYASRATTRRSRSAPRLKGSGGKVDDTEAFRTAMLKADFKSIRGNFKFGPNQHPIQDWYALRVEKGADGKPTIKTRARS